MPPRRSGLALVAALALALPGCPAPSEPLPDLTGHWRGEARIATTALPTPLDMDLTDAAGTLTGAGGGVDCRYFTTCGSFFSYTVAGSHDARRLTLQGRTPQGRTWTARGTLGADGRSLSGTISSDDFSSSPWSMTRS
jgi:hypothetical protein